jgi:uncharacterized membrane protein YccC
MNDPTLPNRPDYILPDEPRDPWPPVWQRLLVFAVAMILAVLFGWMMGHAVGWP